jgi:hypothetical protein
MQTIEFPTHTASRPSYCTRPADNAVSRMTGDLIGSGFPATLLAMAGHDRHQPLQVITSAHDVLTTMLREHSGNNQDPLSSPLHGPQVRRDISAIGVVVGSGAQVSERL